MENQEIELQSGVKLVITVASFAHARALYQAVLEEVKTISLDPKADVDVNLFKDLFCSLLASKKVEAALNECMKKAMYDGLRIDEKTFEPIKAREDYLQVCIEVAKANILPFGKTLMQQFSPILEKLKKGLA